MLLIGFVHGLVFPGDIIGAYGLVAVLLANLLARKNYSVLYLIGGIISVHCLMNPVLGQRIRTLRGAYGSNSWTRKAQRACKQRRRSL